MRLQPVPDKLIRSGVWASLEATLHDSLIQTNTASLWIIKMKGETTCINVFNSGTAEQITKYGYKFDAWPFGPTSAK